jgi:hypothetical protein
VCHPPTLPAFPNAKKHLHHPIPMPSRTCTRRQAQEATAKPAKRELPLRSTPSPFPHTRTCRQAQGEAREGGAREEGGAACARTKGGSRQQVTMDTSIDWDMAVEKVATFCRIDEGAGFQHSARV